MKISIKFEPRDIWVGVYWKKTNDEVTLAGWKWLKVYICLLPFFPIKVAFARKEEAANDQA